MKRMIITSYIYLRVPADDGPADEVASPIVIAISLIVNAFACILDQD